MEKSALEVIVEEAKERGKMEERKRQEHEDLRLIRKFLALGFVIFAVTFMILILG